VGVHSTQDWADDPEVVELEIPESFLSYAEACLDFMRQVQNADEVKTWNGFDYKLFSSAGLEHGALPEGCVTVEGEAYAPFEPEYSLDGCDVRVDRYGDIKVELPFKHTPEKISFSIGTLDELKAGFEAAQQEEQAAKPAVKMGL
jgi:hypothetical protein